MSRVITFMLFPKEKKAHCWEITLSHFDSNLLKVKGLYLSNFLCKCVCMSVYPANTCNLKFVMFLGLFILFPFVYLFSYNSSVYNHHVLLGNEWKNNYAKVWKISSWIFNMWESKLSGWSCVRGKNTSPMPLILCLWERYQNQEWDMIGHSL